jgi:hypothetical protein
MYWVVLFLCMAVYLLVTRNRVRTRDTTSELWLGCSCCTSSRLVLRLPGGPAMLAYTECTKHMCAKWNVAHARINWIDWIELAIRANPQIRTIHVEDHDDRHCPYILALFTRRVFCDHVSPQNSTVRVRRLLQSRFPTYVQLE